MQPQDREREQLLINMAAVMYSLRLADKGCLQVAEEIVKQVAEKDPNFFWAHYVLGRILVETERWDEAASELRRAIELDPSYSDTHTLLGEVLFFQKKYEEAKKEFASAISLAPEDPSVYYNYGYFLSQLGNYAEAISQYEQAIAKDPSHSDSYNNLVSVYYELGQYEQALKVAEDHKKYVPNDPRAWYNYGVVATKLGNKDKAEQAYRKALELRQEYYQASINLGELMLQKDRFDEAEQLMLTALKYIPAKEKSVALLNLARIYLKKANTILSQDEELLFAAIEKLNEAIVDNPNDSNLRYLRAYIRAQVGDAKGVKDDLIHCLQYNQNHKKAERSLNRLLRRERVASVDRQRRYLWYSLSLLSLVLFLIFTIDHVFIPIRVWVIDVRSENYLTLGLFFFLATVILSLIPSVSHLRIKDLEIDLKNVVEPEPLELTRVLEPISEADWSLEPVDQVAKKVTS